MDNSAASLYARIFGPASPALESGSIVPPLSSSPALETYSAGCSAKGNSHGLEDGASGGMLPVCFVGWSIDDALRHFVKSKPLPDDFGTLRTQMDEFCRAYAEQNPRLLLNSDEIHRLAQLLITQELARSRLAGIPKDSPMSRSEFIAAVQAAVPIMPAIVAQSLFDNLSGQVYMGRPAGSTNSTSSASQQSTPKSRAASSSSISMPTWVHSPTGSILSMSSAGSLPTVPAHSHPVGRKVPHGGNQATPPSIRASSGGQKLLASAGNPRLPGPRDSLAASTAFIAPPPKFAFAWLFQHDDMRLSDELQAIDAITYIYPYQGSRNSNSSIRTIVPQGSAKQPSPSTPPTPPKPQPASSSSSQLTALQAYVMQNQAVHLAQQQPQPSQQQQQQQSESQSGNLKPSLRINTKLPEIQQQQQQQQQASMASPSPLTATMTTSSSGYGFSGSLNNSLNSGQVTIQAGTPVLSVVIASALASAISQPQTPTTAGGVSPRGSFSAPGSSGPGALASHLPGHAVAAGTTVDTAAATDALFGASGSGGGHSTTRVRSLTSGPDDYESPCLVKQTVLDQRCNSLVKVAYASTAFATLAHELIRKWVKCWMAIDGAALVLFRDWAWFQKNRETVRQLDIPARLLSFTNEPRGEAVQLLDVVAVSDPGLIYEGYHTFRIVFLRTGQALDCRVKSYDQARRWVQLINYASAYATLGVPPPIDKIRAAGLGRWVGPDGKNVSLAPANGLGGGKRGESGSGTSRSKQRVAEAENAERQATLLSLFGGLLAKQQDTERTEQRIRTSIELLRRLRLGSVSGTSKVGAAIRGLVAQLRHAHLSSEYLLCQIQILQIEISTHFKDAADSSGGGSGGSGTGSNGKTGKGNSGALSSAATQQALSDFYARRNSTRPLEPVLEEQHTDENHSGAAEDAVGSTEFTTGTYISDHF
ncbi:hypothetical protein HK105_207511 [Polyrhizophydium stewartii]|uniref:SEC7 domain-containing protein n=1 Tax=Polyrhizophydium stewartii TaxID=2732419 RepID=A0ABR4N085_9FUNG